MRRIKAHILLVAFGFAVIFPLAAHAKEPQSKFLDIQEVQSDSGIIAWLVEDHSLPIIAIEYAFRGMGTKNDPNDKQGLVRMLSNTMDEGAGDLKSEDFQKTLQDKSITLRFSASRDHFNGSLKTLSRYKEKAFELLTLALTTPRFDEDPVNRMRASNQARIKSSMSQPDWIAARLQNDIIFDNHPYAQNSGGTLSSLNAIKPSDLKTVHQKLGTNQLVIAVAGDISASDLKTLLDTVFAKMPKGTEVSATTGDEKSLSHAGKTYAYHMDTPQTVVEISQSGISRKDDNYYPAKVMNFILGESGFGSRLMEEIREKRGLTYGIYSYFRDYDEKDVMHVSTSTENKNVAPMLELIRAEWSRIKTQSVSDGELNDAKSYLIGSLPLSFTSTDAIASVLLSLQLDHLPRNYLDQRSASINAISASDIQKAAQSILKEDSFTTILVGAPDGIDGAEKITTLPNVE